MYVTVVLYLSIGIALCGLHLTLEAKAQGSTYLMTIANVISLLAVALSIVSLVFKHG